MQVSLSLAYFRLACSTRYDGSGLTLDWKFDPIRQAILAILPPSRTNFRMALLLRQLPFQLVLHDMV